MNIHNMSTISTTGKYRNMDESRNFMISTNTLLYNDTNHYKNANLQKYVHVSSNINNMS